MTDPASKMNAIVYRQSFHGRLVEGSFYMLSGVNWTLLSGGH